MPGPIVPGIVPNPWRRQDGYVGAAFADGPGARTTGRLTVSSILASRRRFVVRLPEPSHCPYSHRVFVEFRGGFISDGCSDDGALTLRWWPYRMQSTVWPDPSYRRLLCSAIRELPRRCAGDLEVTRRHPAGLARRIRGTDSPAGLNDGLGVPASAAVRNYLSSATSVTSLPSPLEN